MKKNVGLDILRSLAILLVLLQHCDYDQFRPLLNMTDPWSWSGVDLFFVLSGYLVSHKIFKIQKLRPILFVLKFYFRRALRILPAYWVVLSAYSFFPILWERKNMDSIWKYLIFVINFGQDIDKFGVFSHSWSLCVEEHFYLLLPLLFLFFKKTVSKFSLKIFGWGIALLLISECALRTFLFYHHVNASEYPFTIMNSSFLKWIYYPTHTHLDGLILGTSLAVIENYQPKLWAKILSHGNKLFFFGLVIFVVTLFVIFKAHYPVISHFSFLLFSISYSLMVMAALSHRCLFLSKPILGSSSGAALAYSLYLTHKPVFKFVPIWIKYFNLPDQTWTLIVFTPIALGVASGILYVLIERPFLKLRESLCKA